MPRRRARASALALGLRLAVLLAILSPVAATLGLGPALAPFAAFVLGDGTAAHACACGMKPGTCGCPECAWLVGHEATSASIPSPRPALRACDSRGRATPPPGLAPCVVPGALVVWDAPRARTQPPRPLRASVPRVPDDPPTRPPRRAQV